MRSSRYNHSRPEKRHKLPGVARCTASVSRAVAVLSTEAPASGASREIWKRKVVEGNLKSVTPEPAAQPKGIRNAASKMQPPGSGPAKRRLMLPVSPTAFPRLAPSGWCSLILDSATAKLASASCAERSTARPRCGLRLRVGRYATAPFLRRSEFRSPCHRPRGSCL